MFIIIGIFLAMWALVYAIIGLIDFINCMKLQAKIQRTWRHILGQYKDEIMAVFFLVTAMIWILSACNKIFYQ